MLRLPALSGRFYPAKPAELSSLVADLLGDRPAGGPARAIACLVPHAAYRYSGAVAGAVFARLLVPERILLLGVRHSPFGAPAAILSSGAWRTPLGDLPVDPELAARLARSSPLLKEDELVHRQEHSLEVQLPFLQTLNPGSRFVPVALGLDSYEPLVELGKAIGKVIAESAGPVLLVASSDLNHYEDETTTRIKDRLAIDRLLALDPRGLYDVCRKEEISMCGVGPAVAMLTALEILGGSRAELVNYQTSADRSGERERVVGYAGMIFN